MKNHQSIVALLLASLALSLFGFGNVLSSFSDYPGASPELGFSSQSPSGERGGAIIPASCESGYQHPPYTGFLRRLLPPPEICGPICQPNAGQACTSSGNICGQTSGGTIACDGTCSAGTPSNASCNGVPCTSGANACGQTNGTYDANGTCVPPAVPAGYGSACNSAPNVCGQTRGGGTIQCNGQCSATPPPPPLNYGFSCTGPANSCGLRNFGSIGCTNNCSAQFAPPESQCEAVNTATTGTTLTASPQTTGINGYSTLSWQSDQSSCSLYNPTSGIILATSTSGTLRVGPLSSATRYILTCGNKTVSLTVRTDFQFNEF